MLRIAFVQPSGNPVIRQHKKGPPRLKHGDRGELWRLGDRIGPDGDRTGRPLERSGDCREGTAPWRENGDRLELRRCTGAVLVRDITLSVQGTPRRYRVLASSQRLC